MRYDRIAAMNRARERKPQAGGKLYRQSTTRTPSPARDSWGWLYGSARAAWDTWAGIAQEDYLRVAFPERYEGFEQ